MPAISVLIAVHNGMPYLESAVRSVMEQTFTDIEIIIVDDASSDETPAVLARLAEEDPRIRVITAETNLRLPGALNRGLQEVRAPLVARMDADDLANPRRLEIQKAYMDAHPDVVLSGTSIDKINEKTGMFPYPDTRFSDPFQARFIALFSMPLVHPTFIFRHPIGPAPGLTYDASVPTAEDYRFTASALNHGGVTSIVERTLWYRVHPGSVSVSKVAEQNKDARRVAEAVQSEVLPAELVPHLTPILDAFYAPDTPLDMAGIVKGYRRLIRYLNSSKPGYAGWMRGYTVLVLVYLMQRRGLTYWPILRQLLRHCPDFLPPAYVFRARTHKRAQATPRETPPEHLVVTP